MGDEGMGRDQDRLVERAEREVQRKTRKWNWRLRTVKGIRIA